jgi:hypothetical protein
LRLAMILKNVELHFWHLFRQIIDNKKAKRDFVLNILFWIGNILDFMMCFRIQFEFINITIILIWVCIYFRLFNPLQIINIPVVNQCQKNVFSFIMNTVFSVLILLKLFLKILYSWEKNRRFINKWWIK